MPISKRAYQIEGLEPRNLLSAAHVTPAAVVSTLRVRTINLIGSVSGSFGLDTSLTLQISGSGAIRRLGAITAVGSATSSTSSLSPGSIISGPLHVSAADGTPLADLTLNGRVPRSSSRPIPVTLTGVTSTALDGSAHALKGTGTLRVLSVNPDGTGTFRMSFQLTGRR